MTRFGGADAPGSRFGATFASHDFIVYSFSAGTVSVLVTCTASSLWADPCFDNPPRDGLCTTAQTWLRRETYLPEGRAWLYRQTDEQAGSTGYDSRYGTSGQLRERRTYSLKGG